MLLTLLYLLAAFIAAVLLFVMVYHVRRRRRRRHGVATATVTMATGKLWYQCLCLSVGRRRTS